MGRLWLAIVAAALLVLASGPAEAQFSGGSMGGSSWGGSSSSYSSSSSWGGSSSGYSYSSGGGQGCQGEGGDAGLWLALVLMGAIGLIAFIAYLTPAVEPRGSVDVSVLRLGIDWKERAHVQHEMKRIAKQVDTSNRAGLLEMLQQVAKVLRRSKDSWLYAGVVDAKPMTRSRAEGFFNSQTMDARERFKAELIRNADGATSERETPNHLVAGFDEGEGLVVITIVMAVKGTLNDFGTMDSVESVRAWLEGIGAVKSHSLAACEVIWSPAAENDRLSSAELEIVYPEMKKLHHAVAAGRAECAFCHGHFPAELRTCPHCGGKAKDAA